MVTCTRAVAGAMTSGQIRTQHFEGRAQILSGMTGGEVQGEGKSRGSYFKPDSLEGWTVLNWDGTGVYQRKPRIYQASR